MEELKRLYLESLDNYTGLAHMLRYFDDVRAMPCQDAFTYLRDEKVTKPCGAMFIYEDVESFMNWLHYERRPTSAQAA